MSTLAASILSLVVVHTTPSGRPVYAPHFRTHKLGAEGYAAQLAHAFEGAADAHGVPAALLAALAFCESAFNARAVAGDRVGSFGVLQLNPRGARARSVLRACARDAAHCVEHQADAGAEMLRDALDACGGNESLALGFYRTGRCVEHKGSARVLALRDRIHAEVLQ